MSIFLNTMALQQSSITSGFQQEMSAKFYQQYIHRVAMILICVFIVYFLQIKSIVYLKEKYERDNVYLFIFGIFGILIYIIQLIVCLVITCFLILPNMKEKITTNELEGGLSYYFSSLLIIWTLSSLLVFFTVRIAAKNEGQNQIKVEIHESFSRVTLIGIITTIILFILGSISSFNTASVVWKMTYLFSTLMFLIFLSLLVVFIINCFGGNLLPPISKYTLDRMNWILLIIFIIFDCLMIYTLNTQAKEILKLKNINHEKAIEYYSFMTVWYIIQLILDIMQTIKKE